MIITATHRGLNHKFNNSNNDNATDGIGGERNRWSVSGFLLRFIWSVLETHVPTKWPHKQENAHAKCLETVKMRSERPLKSFKKKRKQQVFGKCLQINTWAPTPKMPHCFRNRFGEVPLWGRKASDLSIINSTLNANNREAEDTKKKNAQQMQHTFRKHCAFSHLQYIFYLHCMTLIDTREEACLSHGESKSRKCGFIMSTISKITFWQVVVSTWRAGMIMTGRQEPHICYSHCEALSMKAISIRADWNKDVLISRQRRQGFRLRKLIQQQK